MNRNRRDFLGWFIALMGFFVLANLTGFVRPRGLLPFRSTGFPFTVAVWGTSVEEFFDWSAVLGNAAIAVIASGVVAVGVAGARSRRIQASAVET